MSQSSEKAFCNYDAEVFASSKCIIMPKCDSLSLLTMAIKNNMRLRYLVIYTVILVKYSATL